MADIRQPGGFNWDNLQYWQEDGPEAPGDRIGSGSDFGSGGGSGGTTVPDLLPPPTMDTGGYGGQENVGTPGGTGGSGLNLPGMIPENNVAGNGSITNTTNNLPQFNVSNSLGALYTPMMFAQALQAVE
jgi:hypothetical protein